MTVMQKAEELLFKMSSAEKVQLLQLIARELSGAIPGVVKTEGVCGGSARIAGTRIPIWVLIEYRRLGMSEAALLNAYPTLRSEDLVNASSYYRTHREEIDQEILENEMA